MAKKIVLVDDLDSSHNARTIRFPGLDDHEYEIDLSYKNEAELFDHLRNIDKFLCLATPEKGGAYVAPSHISRFSSHQSEEGSHSSPSLPSSSGPDLLRTNRDQQEVIFEEPPYDLEYDNGPDDSFDDNREIDNSLRRGDLKNDFQRRHSSSRSGNYQRGETRSQYIRRAAIWLKKEGYMDPDDTGRIPHHLLEKFKRHDEQDNEL